VNDCSPEISVPCEVVMQGVVSRAKLLPRKVRPMSSGKKRVFAPEGTRRGMGPGDSTQIVEITSGRAISQQGLTTTCEDLSLKPKKRGEGRVLVWRMSRYERRRKGNAFRQRAGLAAAAGNTQGWQSGSGYLAAPSEAWTLSRAHLTLRGGLTLEANQTGKGCICVSI